ncbi:MAG: hypothetical protein Q4D55_01895 [Eubacteriales bacterium]|nr:hypothetical protein [Eubacteriales bacterium]
MKKLTALSLFACISLSITGCSAGELVNTYLLKEESSGEEPISDKPRVYMDEVTGRLLDFTGSQLTMRDDEENIYSFDVSAATLECAGGMITGDEVSVIYEGRFSGTDTSQVRALKVVDEYHKKTQLEDRTAKGRIISLTPNTLTIRARSGKTATYPITGTEQYYQNGIQEGGQVILHFKGKFSKTEGGSSVLSASHLKVTSISDTEPLQIPEPTPTPEPAAAQTVPEREQTKQFRGVIQSLSLNILQIIPTTSQEPLALDLSAIPCHFPGGAAPGSGVTVFYTGEAFDGKTLDRIAVTAVTGDDPHAMEPYRMGFTVTGNVQGTTANTVTLQTEDQALVTCLTDGAQNTSSSGLAPGSRLRITFDPSVSKTSNIYTSIKIEDG